jgi:2TM family of unknown function (DUF5676)
MRNRGSRQNLDSELRNGRKGEGMLNPMAFASSLTTLTGAFYLLLYLLGVVWREAFLFMFNAQFLGADVASLLPRDLSAGVFVGTLLVLLVVAWVFGYAWAWMYNRLAAVTRVPQSR